MDSISLDTDEGESEGGDTKFDTRHFTWYTIVFFKK